MVADTSEYQVQNGYSDSRARLLPAAPEKFQCGAVTVCLASRTQSARSTARGSAPAARRAGRYAASSACLSDGDIRGVSHFDAQHEILVLSFGGGLLLAGSAHRRFAFTHRTSAPIAFWFGADNQPNVRPEPIARTPSDG
jgi:hypothetical protein